jgi:predicted GIY-YIG superfamily endonuclease
MFYFYLLRCKDGTLYCGSTNNLERRLKLHNAGRGSAYVKSRGGGEIVYSESFETIGDAMRKTAFLNELLDSRVFPTEYLVEIAAKVQDMDPALPATHMKLKELLDVWMSNLPSNDELYMRLRAFHLACEEAETYQLLVTCADD